MNFFFVYSKTDGTLQGLPYATPSPTWTNIPNGCAVLGPIADSDTTAQAAAQAPTEWTVQNGALVHSNPPTAAELLLQAQVAQISLLTRSRDATIAAAGFTSSADSTGTNRTYKSDVASQTLMDQLSESISLGIEVYPQAWVASDGTQVQFSDVTAAKQFLQDFATMKNQYWSQYMPLQHNVISATTVADVQAVVPPSSWQTA